ncbi:SPOR domain-containing protein [Algicella marina]|uniref:SPOR domain-containing protein n=1 Tax=Algicella marina TaxID=2683284 RepID=A0A6P1SUB1_9RHOB|nr:SPOR domain-containing protein [Algicella marina]QHQ34264.1 hypothetical protein GO499_03185 [Algicella marina]
MQDMTYGDSHEEGPVGAAFWVGVLVKWGGALLSLALVVLLVLWAWRLTTRDPGEVPVIKALGGAVRVAPEVPGGRTENHQGLEVNEVLAGEEAGLPRQAELAPPPATLAEEDQPGPLAPEVLPAIPEDPSEAPETITVEREGGDEVEVEVPGGSGDDLQALINEAVRGVVEEPAESGGNEIVAVLPRPRPSDLRAGTGAVSQSTAVGTESAQTGSEIASVAIGTRTIQLGAFDSERDARTAWDQLARLHTDLLASRDRYIQEAQSNGRTFYRLRVLGFDSSAEQNSLCEALKARLVACIPVTAR